MKTILYACALFLFIEILFPTDALPGDWHHAAGYSQATLTSDSLSLPLAANTSELARPFFQTIHYDFSIGIAFCDFSELQPLIGSSNINARLGFFIEIPFHWDGPVSLISGSDFALGGGGGGRLYTFSTFLVYRHESSSMFKPIIGVGIARTMYDYGRGDVGSIAISAKETYPVIIVGLNLVPNVADALLSVPLGKDLQTSFESKSYTIQPAGFILSVLMSL
jgi:hypothetical protein